MKIFVSIWINITLLIILTTANILPWGSTIHGNSVGQAFAAETSSSPEAESKSIAVTSDNSDAKGIEEEDGRNESAEDFLVGIDILDVNPMDPTIHNVPQFNILETGNGTSTVEDKLIPDVEDNKEIHPVRRIGRSYYAQLSAEPGTDQAREEHTAVKVALMRLPGHVTIRQEFGIDKDDVLNVISFKLEGEDEGLETVAAVKGVIGIYPVRTRRRPKALPLGSLKLTKPNLKSAHILTGVSMVHEKLGLTGKGIKVGIIDTGVDYKHPALGGCFGPGCKVAYGYDFVGDNYDNSNPENDIPRPDSDPMDCAGHGTHVAGIVAARNEGLNAMGTQQFVGVAPDVTIGAYRVFGCNGEVSDDILLAAIKAAYRDGMDIVNLSLGGSSGWPEEPFALACSAYIAKGLHLAIANGNDGDQGLFEDGAPATAAGSIAVGSVDNTHFMGTAGDLSWQTLSQRGIPIGQLKAIGRIGTALASDESDVLVRSFNSDLPYVVHIPTNDPLGCSTFKKSEFEAEGLAELSRIVVLLRRGECAFSDKAKYISEAGLGGMLVYDVVPEQRPLGMAIAGYNISAGGISLEDATTIITAKGTIGTNPSAKGQGAKLTIKFSSKDQPLKLASGGKISDFTSWGPDARLRYKPDIVTPGGMIYSTFPRDKGGFATLQGTSMASPYMAGIQALYLSKYGKIDPPKLLRLLQTTAKPTIKPGSAKGLTSVFQQGGGLVSMEKLFSDDLPTIVTPAALYLNDTQYQTLDHQITIHNPSVSTTRIWTMVHRPAFSVNGFEQDGNHYTPVNQSGIRTSEIGASISVSPPQLKLAPGASGTIRVHVIPPAKLRLEERWLYSGYIELMCQTDRGIPCDSSTVSYGGMHGHLADIPILNPALAFPAIQLDRFDEYAGIKSNAMDDSMGLQGGTKISDEYVRFARKEKRPPKSIFRDQLERVTVGKNQNDWVQILVAVNFPTGLLTIEVESVCDGDHSLGTGGDIIRLEMGDLARSRFEIESKDELQLEENIINQEEANPDDKGKVDPETVALMKARLARSQELAFMPSGLYMPYMGYSSVMLQPSVVEDVIRLHRKKAHRGKAKDIKARNKTNHGTKKSKKSKQLIRRGLNFKKGRRKPPRIGRGKQHGSPRSKKQKPRKNRKPVIKGKPEPKREPRPTAGSPCVPRILGLIPNGFNPWSTRTGSDLGTFQAYSWVGDLLLQNHEVNNQYSLGGRRLNKSKAELARDLPNGRYRLVVKALKPWGVRGRASDVERWSSPIIVINRTK